MKPKEILEESMLDLVLEGNADIPFSTFEEVGVYGVKTRQENCTMSLFILDNKESLFFSFDYESPELSYQEVLGQLPVSASHKEIKKELVRVTEVFLSHINKDKNKTPA